MHNRQHGGAPQDAPPVTETAITDTAHVLNLMRQDYAYPKPGDPEFQSKIYEKREFNFHKIPTREHIKTYDDVRIYRDQHCTSSRTLYSHQNFLANIFNPDTPYKGLLVQHGLGSGKCLRGDARVYVHGRFMSIESLFDASAHEPSKWIDADGGEWYRPKPTVPVDTVSVNEATCELTSTTISRFYRQIINEDMVIVTLIDNKRITMTLRHRLLTANGWAQYGAYRVGTVVGVTDDPSPGSSVRWVPISMIERQRHCGYVYDLEINNIHNYIAEGMLCHNTIGAISVAEQFKSLVTKYGTKIHVLVPGPVIKEVWKEQLLKGTKETYMKYHDRNTIIDDAEYAHQRKMALATAGQYYRFMSYRSFSKRVLGERVIERRTAGSVTPDGSTNRSTGSKYRKTDKGGFERDVPVDKIHNLDNGLIIVDEAHNLTGNDYGEALKEIVRRSKNCRVVLLTATPMKNLADDIVELVNFIRPQDSPIERDKIFTSHTGHHMELKPQGLDYLKRMCQGYISYMRGGDPLTFAKRVDIGSVPQGLKFTKVISSRMYPFQRCCYDEAVHDEGDALSKKSEAVANFVVPGLSSDKKKLVGYYGREGIQLVCNQLKTHADLLNAKIQEHVHNWLLSIPEGAQLSESALSAMVNDRDGGDWLRLSDSGKTVTGRLLRMPFLRILSTKFAGVVDGLSTRIEGKRGAITSFCYSNLVKAGIEMFQEVLMQNGYLEFDESGRYKIEPSTICYRCGLTHEHHTVAHRFYPATFVTVTGKVSDDVADYIPEEKQRVIRTVFNTIDNRDGKFIKCVLGSRVMNEGVSLENIGEIDILDVYFNFGRVDQVVGRGIRNCSHQNVISDDNRYPEVKVYKFCITLDEYDADNRLILSSEEELYQKAELKYLLIKRVERALKEIAIDCALNRNGNIFADEVAQHKGCVARGDCPAICDYMECDYKCDDRALNDKWFDNAKSIYRNIPRTKLDYSTFNKRLARDEINFAKERVKDMYRLTSQYKLGDIVSYVRLGYIDDHHRELFDEIFVYRALDELLPKTENDFNNFRDTVLDGYGNAGYLIHRGEYYIFQPINQTENVPMYYRINYYRDMLNKLSLFSFMRTTVDWSKIDSRVGAIEPDTSIATETEKQEVPGYDFESVRDYYDNRDENDFIVGVADKDTGRRRFTDNVDDVFKLRPKREKILEKKRGTHVYSFFGAACVSKPKTILEGIAVKLGLPVSIGDPDVSRIELCSSIQNKLVELEKYSTDNKTYFMVPANHSTYAFPLNLVDRVKHITDRIRNISSVTSVRVVPDAPDPETGYIKRYTLTVKPHGEAVVKLLVDELHATKSAKNTDWRIIVD